MSVVNLPRIEIAPLSDHNLENASTFLFDNWHAHYQQQLPGALIDQRSPDFFRQQLNRKLRIAWLALFGSRIVGLVTVSANCIDDIWVEAEYRRRGIGENLLETATVHIGKRGYITAQVGLEGFNEVSQFFFQSMGWKQIGSDHIHLGSDTWIRALVYSRKI